MDNRTHTLPDRVGKILIGIFLLALCVRLVHAIFFVGLQTLPPGDGNEFLAYADNLVSSHGYTAWGNQAFRAPGYPVFIAAVFYIFGKSYPILKILQVLISSLIPVLVCLIGFKIASRKIAILAGVYTCFYYGLVIEPSTIMTEATFTFLFTLTVFLFLRAREKASLAIAAGLSLALLTLTRPVGLVALPLFFAWLYFILSRKDFVRTAVIIAAVSVAAMAPWWARNYRIYHAFIPVCLETGAVMENVHIPMGKRTPNRYKGLSEYEKDRLKTQDALAHLKQQGAAPFLKGGLQRLATFFYPFVPAYDITWFFMCPFWLLGMYVIVKQRNKQAYILFLHFIYFPIYFFFCPTTRFKYSISQFMILFASAGFFYLFEKYRNNRKFHMALAGWTLANIIVWLNAPFFRAIALKAKELY
jgi:4-amino-4-deoxy-L-arabinose transferase-like glycosyltransferase